MKSAPYSVEKIHPFRQLVIARKHHIHGLVEVDITEARTRIRQIKEKTGESLSFTGFIVYCCAKAAGEDRHLHAYRDWRNRLILFEDVDISLPVERTGQGHPP